MSDLVGGCWLFEPEQTRAALIAATFQAMELQAGAFEVLLPEEDGFPRFAGEGYPLRTEATPDLSLAALAQLEGGVIEAKGPDQREIFWFDPPAGPYPAITIWIPDSAMFYDKLPAYNEALVLRWLELCEQGKAVFGYLSPFEFMFERDYVEAQILPPLEQGDLKQLLKANSVCWLIYLGPKLAHLWRQEHPSLPFAVQVSQELLSGAHFFRTRTQAFP